MKFTRKHLLFSLKKGVVQGVGFALALLTTTLIAGTITGAFHVFFPGQAISSSQVNENFASLKSAVESIDFPVGSIIAWNKSKANTPALPEGWVECDGATINVEGSVYEGASTPNLNNQYQSWNTKGVFLRGDTTSGSFQDDAFQGHAHYYKFSNITFGGSGLLTIDLGGGGVAQASSDAISTGFGGVRYTTETRPVNFSVVWIMKVK